MYDEGHLWYVRTESVGLRQRLANLSQEKLLFYAVGCATHAKDVLLASVEKNSDEYLPSAHLLDAFWKDYPHSLAGDGLHSLMDRAEQVVTQQLGSEPDQHFLTTPGAEPLLWATLYALSLSRSSNSVTAAYDAVDKAYFAVFIRFGQPDGRFDASQMHVIECRTQECLQEIDFQLHLLKAVEEAETVPPPYASILKNMSSHKNEEVNLR